ncbi:MAG: hydrogenase [Desulfuromonadaceae bacterium]|nr:hydrogenase [Desulfuromonadaceae bacterium]
MTTSLPLFLGSLLLLPLLAGLIPKVKAFLTGKKGPPLLIKYYTLIKLLAKGSVYSTSTTFVFRAAPVVVPAVYLTALLFLPLAGMPPVLSFSGDIILIFYLFALGRFFTICAALDTASPFEGMGTSREAFFSVLSEATVFMVLFLFCRLSSSLELAGFFTGSKAINLSRPEAGLLLLVVVAMFIVLLTENARVPVDDPATHLELTMIHEVMILDHSGPDLALLELGAWCKLYFYAVFVANILLPGQVSPAGLRIMAFLGSLLLIYAVIGVVESVTARYKMPMVPKFILTSFAFAFFAAILTLEWAR